MFLFIFKYLIKIKIKNVATHNKTMSLSNMGNTVVAWSAFYEFIITGYKCNVLYTQCANN